MPSPTDVPPRRKALLTYATGPHRELLRLSLPTFERYASTHGYELLAPARCPLPAGRSPHWARIVLLEEALSDHDFVLWLDADTMVVDLAPDVARELPERDFQGFVLEQVSWRPDPDPGVWAMRSDERSAAFLAEVWDGSRGLGWSTREAVLRSLGCRSDPAPSGAGLGDPARHLAGTAWLSPAWNWIVGQGDSRLEPYVKHWAGDPGRRLAGMRAEAARLERLLVNA